MLKFIKTLLLILLLPLEILVLITPIQNYNIIGSKVVSITGYQPTIEQCDSTPNITADGSIITEPIDRLKWCAISPDLKKQFKFGDSIYIMHPNMKLRGWWYIHDIMNPRLKDKVDLLTNEKKVTIKTIKIYWNDN
jgi:3D (Asp-Asp-Asp) domain-containing protein